MFLLFDISKVYTYNNIYLRGDVMVDYKAIGRRIKKYRKERHMTQAVMSEYLNVSENYVSQIQRGFSRISLSRLYEIAEILEIDVALLVSDGSKFHDFNFTSEIDEMIKGWSPEAIDMLLELISCADRKMKSN